MSCNIKREDCKQNSLGVFLGTSKEEWESTSCHLKKISRDKRKLIYFEGETAVNVFVIQSGFVKVFKGNPGNHVQNLNLLGPGEILSIDALFRSFHSESATALTKVELCICPQKQFIELMMTSPRIALRMMELLRNDILQVQSFLYDLGQKKSYARVASLVLYLKEKQVGKRSLSFHNPIQNQEMSDFLGMRPETLSRNLKNQEKAGILRRENKRWTILNLEKLKESAG
jgi:CRP-like cAMP-binding protein